MVSGCRIGSKRFALRNTVVHCGCRVCGDFSFRVCEHYSLVLCEMKESREIDSSAFFSLSLSHQHTVSCSEEN